MMYQVVYKEQNAPIKKTAAFKTLAEAVRQSRDLERIAQEDRRFLMVVAIVDERGESVPRDQW